MPPQFSRTVISISQEYNVIKHPWFDRHGVTMEYRSATGAVTFFSAMLQPLRYKNKMYLGGAKTELGFEGKRKYLMIYPPQIDIVNYRYHSCVLICGTYRYLIDRIETVSVGDKAVYNWAIVHRGGDDAV